jgi:hypothetical protein
VQASLARPEKCADESVELLELVHEAERGRQLPCVVAERVDVALSTHAEFAFEALLELGAGETTRHSFARARAREVLEVRARSTCHVEAKERCVAGERPASFTGTKRYAWKGNVAGCAGGEEHGAVAGGTRLERGPVRDDGAREHEGRDLP